MVIEPFETRRAGLVAGWASSAQEATWWAGAPFPVPPPVVLGWQDDPDAQGHLLFDDDPSEDTPPVAYGEIWDDPDERESELAHLIVDPARRGKGFGRALVRELVAAAGYDDLIMRVHPDNRVARNCYLAAGFGLVDASRAAVWNEGQPIAYIWLELRR